MAGTSGVKVLVLGGGTGGISVSAKLRSLAPDLQISIIEPSENHYYQPWWTLAGGGVGSKESSERKTKDLIPSGVTWIKEKLAAIEPSANRVRLESGTIVSYDYLIVATGLKLDWGKIEGLQGNLGKNGICTIYEYNQIDATARMINEFDSGTALFVMPPVPIKCAGAPQKIMYIAERVFRDHGVRHKVNIEFVTAGKAMFGIPAFAEALAKIADEKGIARRFSHKLVAVDAEKKEAIFDVAGTDGSVSKDRVKYDLLHVVPTMSPHSFISDTDLAFQEGDQKGWLAVNKNTLQHLKYPNVFGIGDVTGVPNSKTGAAIRAQYPVVAKNLISFINGQPLAENYDGYASCPLITDIGKVMLIEFGYDSKLMPTFPLDPTITRKSYWHLKKDLLPVLYWHGMMKGRV